ncbi:helix-turn-helix domain-containing protein [Bradyrhizobium sp. 61]|uniref:helix-turn-helix domain-containing protein n=1 Tax=unclassified Bradyrhizobium TaxID=2631580 RepID=UPI001FFBEBE0|nr:MULTISPECIES: helix-turn-helix domain-containing protein [unclassified Bradyrhizobium]MCK1274718.1 helix-turn-helix domain-containing protein [Bradyrhizobium sp. 61]MCK1441712.1 helix-turn-helix domain-containing protein [Bradyrhizobium sp. 48]MCK1465254.1 helix-turn-helix domain-containing protein [Bradyrhizobium sp. 2]
MRNWMPLDWITRHVDGVVRQGLPFEQIMAASLIGLRHGDNRDLVGPAQYLLLCMNTALGIADAAHGLARFRIDPAYTALGLRVALGCTTLEDAILAVAQLYRTTSRAVHIELKTTHDVAVVNVRASSAQETDAVLLEDIYLSWIFMHCMYFLGVAMPVIAVSTRDPLHFNLGRRHFAIDAPVHYGAVTGMQFSRSLLGRRGLNRAGANPHWECFRLWLDFIEQGGGSRTGPENLPDAGRLRMKDVAERFGVSTSTMRRRLSSDGGFRQARGRKLVTAAIDRLQSSDDSVESIAAELGYSDARSLRRFLKATTGATPQQLRIAGSSPQPDDSEVRLRLQAIGAAMAQA